MRKIACLLAISALLMVSLSFAESPPREGTPSEGKTTFANIAVVGLGLDGLNGTTNTGTPGYIEMINGKGYIYYLFIDSLGVLRVASAPNVGFQASPAIVGWSDASGRVVGSQLTGSN